MYHFRIILFISIFSLLGSVGCEKEELENEWFNAEVLGKGIDCGDTFLINFMEGDKEKIYQILKMEDAWFPTYYAWNLPNEFKVEGLQVRIKFKSPSDEDVPPCTCVGPGFGHIWIKKVKEFND